MDCIDLVLKVVIATFGGFCGYFLGGWDATLKVLVTMVIIDCLTGMIETKIVGTTFEEINGYQGSM